jgi:hypothetical protein
MRFLPRLNDFEATAVLVLYLQACYCYKCGLLALYLDSSNCTHREPSVHLNWGQADHPHIAFFHRGRVSSRDVAALEVP